MSEQLTQYFEHYAESAIEQMKKATLAIGFYRRLHARLLAGEDLSDEVPLVGTVGPEKTLAVVVQALADYKKQITSAWELPSELLEIGKHKVSQTMDPHEHLPRVDVMHQYKSEAGLVKVHITTAGEVYKLNIDAGKNPMAAQLACFELEKRVIFLALTRRPTSQSI
jgi:hypothetical protein